ncbi:MAG: ribonuclease H-like domain-containing protein [Bacillota bacterium]|nr:ribonuclease H-like domain-containing protein [Bacillota bacterium]
MEILTERREEAFYRSAAFLSYFENARLGVLDIETTGLSPGAGRVVLAGLLTPEKGGLSLRQYFSSHRDSEGALLNAVAEEIRKLDAVITYNGDSFDLPFLRERAERRGLSFPEGFHSLDLYQIFHRHSPFREFLPDLKQKTLERFAGLSPDRLDEIDGKKSVELYYAYCRRRDPSLKEKILLHNRDDVLQLARLLRLLDKLDLHEILYARGFPVVREGRRALIKRIALEGCRLRVRGTAAGGAQDHYAYGESYFFRRQASTGEFLLELTLAQEESYLFIDLTPLPFPLEALERSPDCHSGYLLLAEGPAVYHSTTNRLLQAILGALLTGQTPL